jgi:hypothetical protein
MKKTIMEEDDVSDASSAFYIKSKPLEETPTST